jgi:hypothetical protein
VPFPFDHERAGVAHGQATVACNSLRHSVPELATEWLKDVLP